MADTQIKAWTISVGVVGKKAVRHSYGGALAAMHISTSRHRTTVSWSGGTLPGEGRAIWQGVVSTLVGAN